MHIYLFYMCATGFLLCFQPFLLFKVQLSWSDFKGNLWCHCFTHCECLPNLTPALIVPSISNNFCNAFKVTSAISSI